MNDLHTSLTFESELKLAMATPIEIFDDALELWTHVHELQELDTFESELKLAMATSIVLFGKP